MLRRLEDRIVGEMTDHERTMLRHSALWFFLVLFGYYILRPVREQISTEYGVKNLAWMFRATFITMLVAIPSYSVLVGKFHRKILVPCIYVFFATGLVGFWAAMRFISEAALASDLPLLGWVDQQFVDRGRTAIFGDVTQLEWVARILFISISVYGVFIVSFFWSVVGDMFGTEQGRRLFGVVAGGGTAGGLLASLVAISMVERVGQANLLLLPALLLVVGLLVYASLERCNERYQATKATAKGSGKATGGNPFAGFTAVFKSKYLFAVCMYVLLLAVCGTTVYFQQSEIVSQAIETKEAKTKFFSQIDFVVQIITLLLQTTVVGRLMKKFGLGLTLAVLPMAYVVGITSLALAPTIAVLAVISVTGRAAEYAIANPAREVLFTAVKREERYKAKSFIDTIVRRGGDTMVASLYHTLTDAWGVAMTTLSWCIAPVAACWVVLGLFIGDENKRVIASNADCIAEKSDDAVKIDNER